MLAAGRAPDQMRILHLSSSDAIGGAAKAAYRLHDALRQAGYESSMLVRDRVLEDPDVEAVPAVTPLVAGWRTVRRHLPVVGGALARPAYTFDRDLVPDVRTSVLFERAAAADVVTVHWTAGLLTVSLIARLARLKPLVWSVLDQGPVTGGCHYSFGCERYTTHCGPCPQLRVPFRFDHSRVVFERKRRRLAPLPITFVAPTSRVETWLRKSALFAGHRIERIPLALDSSRYRPDRRVRSRDELGFPADALVLFAGATHHDDPRKGAPQLLEALRSLAAQPSAARLRLLVAGAESERLLRETPLRGTALGLVADEDLLADAYAAADVFICPSIEDAGPMMIPEAMLCGTPVAAFATGGAPDLVREGITGALAPVGDGAALAQAIGRVLARAEPQAMRAAARAESLALHDSRSVAADYLDLYRALLAA